MTRSRKRKMQDGPLLVASTSPAGGSGNSSSNTSTSGSGSGGAVSITPTYPNVTVTKRERTMQPSEANFPGLQHAILCDGARGRCDPCADRYRSACHMDFEQPIRDNYH